MLDELHRVPRRRLDVVGEAAELVLPLPIVHRSGADEEEVDVGLSVAVARAAEPNSQPAIGCVPQLAICDRMSSTRSNRTSASRLSARATRWSRFNA